ncbi:phage integrase family protein [Orientia tsutsugamushi str. UT76]|uniref:Integrase n=1 Tax=Orientia tsutsugamushi TaxID=784 RepID=A0A2U3RF66_ORITS|nr:site-specific integrase [Orientia tsutsugamushi]KJV72719.1 phage integrase family protein [Orientia tsutsugamushi str. UT76]SPR11864.1 integrase [Orientia tsutsugamushi]
MPVKVFKFTQSALNEIKVPTKEEKIIKCRDIIQRNLLWIISYTGFRRFYLGINIGGIYYKIKIGDSPDLTVAKARKKIQQLKRDIANGINPMDERRKINKERREKREKRLKLKNELTFGQVHVKYTEYSSLYHKSWKIMAQRVKRYLESLYNKKISEITKEDIQKIFDEITARKHYVTANSILKLLSPIFNKAIEWGLIEKNPVCGIKRHKEESRSRYVTSEEMGRVMKVLAEKENSKLTEEQKQSKISEKLFLFTALFTAARSGNILAMKWNEISISEKIWCIPKTKTKNGKTLYIGLADKLIEVLQNRKLCSKSEWVFPSPKDNSKHISHSTIHQAWAKIRKKAGIQNVTIHDLRRTFATWMKNNGETLDTISQILGHSDTNMTKIYTIHSLDKATIATNKVVENMLSIFGPNVCLNEILSGIVP